MPDPRSATSRFLLLAVISLTFLGCAPARDASTDSASLAEWTLSPEPVVSIGVRAGDPEYELFRVRAAIRLSDSTIVVANSGSHEIRFYDPTGEHIRSAGRAGEGPGEFEEIYSAQRTRGDTVAVWDNLQRRITYFDPEGQRARDFPLDLAGETIELNSLITPALASDVAFRGDGSFVVVPLIPSWALTGLRLDDEGFGFVDEDAVAVDGVWQAEHPVYLFAPSGQHVATTHPLRSTEVVIHEGMTQTRLFGERFGIAGGGQRVLASTGLSDQVVEISPEGDTSRLNLAIPARAATPEIVEAQIDRSVQSVAESSRSSMRALYASVPTPDSLPGFSRLMIDEQERIWAEAYLTTAERDLATSVRWHVFSAAGEPLATLLVPAELRVSDVSFGFVTGYVRDEFDVERVDSYRVVEVG